MDNTTYEDIYNAFLQKITDYKILELSDSDVKDLLYGYMKSAITQLPRFSSILQDRDDDFEEFNSVLSSTLIDAVSSLMVCEWVRPQLNSMLLTSQFIGAKEEKFYAQSSHISELRKLKSDNENEVQRLLRNLQYVAFIQGSGV